MIHNTAQRQTRISHSYANNVKQTGEIDLNRKEEKKNETERKKIKGCCRLSACNLVFHQILFAELCVLHKLKDLWHELIFDELSACVARSLLYRSFHRFVNTKKKVTRERKNFRNSNGEHVKLGWWQTKPKRNAKRRDAEEKKRHHHQHRNNAKRVAIARGRRGSTSTNQ